MPSAGQRQLQALKAAGSPSEDKFALREATRPVLTPQRINQSPKKATTDPRRPPQPIIEPAARLHEIRPPLAPLTRPRSFLFSPISWSSRVAGPPATPLYSAEPLRQSPLERPPALPLFQPVAPPPVVKREAVLQPIAEEPADAASDTPSGLPNIGNSCFANATLQVMLRDGSFAAGVSGSELRGPLHVALSGVLAGMAAREPNRAAVRSVLAALPEFNDRHQHDAHEFLTAMITALEAECDNGWTRTLFDGTCVQQLSCKCGHSFTREDAYVALPVSTASSRLSDGFDSIFGSSVPDDYKCDSCHEAGSTRIDVTPGQLPRLLVVLVMRYYYDASAGSLVKIHRPLTLPMKLHYPGREQVVYQLRGVVDHVGALPTMGHYTAAVRVGDGDRAPWFHFDDSIVTPISGSDSVRRFASSAACVLVRYERAGAG